MRRGQVQAKKAVWEQWKAAGRQVRALGGAGVGWKQLGGRSGH